MIVFIGLYFRINAVTNTYVDVPLRADAYDYYKYAVNLKLNHTYSRSEPYGDDIQPDAIRTPGFPFLLYAFVKWPPDDSVLFNINIFQALLGVLTIIIAYQLYSRFLSFWFASAAALFTAISPHLISFTTYCLTETLFTFLVCLIAWLLSLAMDKKNTLLFLLAGGIIAYSALTRSTMDFFLVFFICFFILQPELSKYRKKIIPLVIGFLLVFAPWQVRNHLSLDVIKDDTLAINFIHHGMYPSFMYENNKASRGFPYHFDPESEKISSSMQSTLTELYKRYRADKAVYLKWYLLDKPREFFSWGLINGWRDIFVYPTPRSPYYTKSSFKYSYTIMWWLHPMLMVFSIISCVLVWLPAVARQFPESAITTCRLLSVFIIYFILLHMVGAPFPRYSVPLRPLNYGMAIFLLAFCTKIFRSYFSRYRAAH